MTDSVPSNVLSSTEVQECTEPCGEGFAFFTWHCLKWPGESSFPWHPCKFQYGYECADSWKVGVR